MSFFKRLFGIAKANKENVDVNVDFEVKDLKKGYILDYDMRSWEVKDVSEYIWDEGSKDYEFTIEDGKETLYLNYVNATGEMSIYWAGKINEIWPEGKSKMRSKIDLIDEEVKYKGDTYYFLGEGAAKVRNSKETFLMQNWLFENAAQTDYISFNLYEDRSMEAYLGKKIKAFEITNILPR